MGWWWRKRNKKRILARGALLLKDVIECCDGKSNPIKFLSSDEILKATDNFSESSRVFRNLGYGYGWNEWYSSKKENHRKILVKKLYRDGDGSFCRDIAVSLMVSGHKNFMKLVGCCLESEWPFMVYRDVKKQYCLHLDLDEQTWKKRMKIAEDIATALAYLHTAFPRPFVHRCLHLKNILVDEDGDAKLTDFSLCVSIPEGETSVQVDGDPRGIYNYRRLLFSYHQRTMLNGQMSWENHGSLMYKFDVYREQSICRDIAVSTMPCRRSMNREDSFQKKLTVKEEEKLTVKGMMMTLQPCGRRLIRFKRFKLMEERMMDEVADPEMLEKMDEISEHELSQMKAIMKLSLKCIVGCRGIIPTMVEVAKELKKIQTSLN